MTGLTDRLARQHIEQIYYIDDENVPPSPQTVEEIANDIARLPIRALRQAAQSDERLSPLLVTREEVKESDTEERTAAIRHFVSGALESNGLTVPDFQGLLAPLYRNHRGPTAQKLVGPIPDARLKSLSFADWNATSAAILGGASAQQRLLLLIDEVNTAEPQVGLDGIGILASLWRSHLAAIDFLDTIVITSSCTPDGEFDEALRVLKAVRERIGDAQIARQVRRTFVISKARLDGNNIRQQFEIHLDRIRATEIRNALAQQAYGIFRQSIEEFIEWFEQIPLSGFQGSVFASSQYEGTTEIDTLLRLIQLRQRADLEQKLRTDPTVRQHIGDMRKFSLKHLDIDYEKASQGELRSLRQKEFEVPGAQINSLLASIACGDVFKIDVTTENGHSSKLAMLLVNPCDLVLRSNGKRKLQRGWMVELLRIARSELKSVLTAEQEAESGLTYTLSTGKRDDDVIYVFRNSNVDAIDLVLLDLCWTNSDGAVSLDPTKAAQAYEFFMQPQQKRLQRIVDRIDDQPNSVEILGQSVNIQKARCAAVQVASRDITTSVTTTIQRSWRLTPEFAAAALSALSHAISRPAFGHDFLRAE